MSDEFVEWSILFIVLWAIWEFDPLINWREEFILYAQEEKCTYNESIKKEVCYWDNLKLMNFKVSVDYQRIIFWLDNEKDSLIRVDNCVVRNTENWRCQNGWEFAQGKPTLSQYEKIKVIYKTNWWFQHFMRD